MGSIKTLAIAFLLFCVGSASAETIEQQATLYVSKEREAKTKKDNGNKKKRESLDFSDTGRPGQQTAGESRGNCPNTEGSLEAVVPNSHAGKTVSAHPNFWVYFPYDAKQVSHVEFVLQNEAREDIWRSQFKMDLDIGYKSFSLPKTAPPLKIGEWYRWYVKVYCDSRTASAQYVQSWVNRVPLTSRLYLELQEELNSHQTYGNYGIWYDAIDHLFKAYQHQPSSLVLEQDWQNLIEARGVELQNLPQVGANYKAVK